MNTLTVPQNNLEVLLSELRRITAVVASRVSEIQAQNVGEEETEFAGLYVSSEEIEQLLADPQLFLIKDRAVQRRLSTPLDTASRLGHLQATFGLSAFELDVILLALAPELDLRYEKLFVFLQDDISRRRPSVDLALRLLCPGLASQIAARRCFDAAAPLLKYRLIELNEEGQNRQTSLLTRVIKLDESIIAYLLGEDMLDGRLRSVAEFGVTTSNLTNNGEVAYYVKRLSELALTTPDFVSVLVGTDEISKRAVVAEVCHQVELPLIIIDTALLTNSPKLENLVRLLEREARLWGAALYWTSYDCLQKDEPIVQEARRLITKLLQTQPSLSFVAVTLPQTIALAESKRREFQINIEPMGYAERQLFWQDQLGSHAMGLNLESLSSRFRLNRGQIEAAIATARSAASWRGETAPTLDDLEAASRFHSNQRLSSLAHKITPRYRWEDIVLPPDQYSMLREICEQVKHRALVYERWGFEQKFSLGKGLNVIFAGPSGTGKTMSAELIAGELKMDLYKIDLANMVSKYIGETEKNLERIFAEAGESNAILFFDEADSLFGKRSEVKDAHDRYANIETGYLLQKMEEYEGIVILATNLRKNLDDAFIRRIHFILEYPFPDERDRLEIWRRVWPATIQLAPDVDLAFLARQFKISGGNIKNIALAAAFMAASDEESSESNPCIGMKQLVRATRRELQKMGKLCTEADFGPYFGLANS